MFTTFTSPILHLWKTALFAEQKQKCTTTLNKNHQFVH